ncbi:MAG: hypothetical protein K2X31_05830 [Sphingopyxis sp.]|jgi:hypothetical protein|nr:hypothetical protein [Sphingopyxis sp.]
MDLDQNLRRLSERVLPDLSRLDGADLAKAALSDRREVRLTMSVAFVAALFMGMAGGALPSSRVEASVVPFGPPVALTPLVQLGRG